MKKLIAVLALSVAGIVGCEKKSGTAPSVDPNQPGAVRKLTIMASGDHTITQNETDDVKITVTRDNFKEAVTIEVTNLPTGISVDSKDMTIPADQNMITIRLKATADAPATKDATFHIVGKSKDITSAAMNLKLTVKVK